MPYIKQIQRDRLDITVNELILLLERSGTENIDGEINYVMTRLLKSLYPPRYYNFNRAMGVLSCIQAEFYRKVIAPYEEIKEAENGKIPE